ncbi:low-density lipoprotein receptor-like [Anneissia japonica]|uniref:low-density lipoprotein receptor-like n=1 Tax=Anneissia japonica TaxID=1529436 RepID=UPI0014259424|nr:low-density lipoprotein receptor-like [Anneissia japonica]XP_033125502.1 low-density lipoprotein receptor-like [Anneissia japonica]
MLDSINMIKLSVALLMFFFCVVEPHTFHKRAETCEDYEKLGIEAFRCKNKEKGEIHCIEPKFECDSIIDCLDASDEDHCQKQHAEYCANGFEGKILHGKPMEKFQCDDGMCIEDCRRCNGRAECVDKSDEKGCSKEMRRQRTKCDFELHDGNEL